MERADITHRDEENLAADNETVPAQLLGVRCGEDREVMNHECALVTAEHRVHAACVEVISNFPLQGRKCVSGGANIGSRALH